MGILDKHKAIETHATLLMVLSLLVVTIGGIVQIVPLFYLENTIEKVEGVRPYTPLELAGKQIYLREGCYGCYGHYSLAAESMYDRPFQWGSKRTGPDLARVGGRYSDEWHQDHFENAKSVVPESVMPPYGFLADNVIDGKYIQDLVSTHALVGVPYTEDMVNNALADFKAQVDPLGDFDGLEARYGEDAFGTPINVRNFDGQPELTEMDALIAYIQVLGTMVDFSTYTPVANR
ncbi:MAG: cytochrome-c oxidase, cbb3-type subunit II [Tabrizicola sp.]|nr:cytochrome-c oxidase, cbb3-type subunit II [Tabrizicola sp.]